MREGRTVAELDDAAITEDAIMAAMAETDEASPCRRRGPTKHPIMQLQEYRRQIHQGKNIAPPASLILPANKATAPGSSHSNNL